jgi:ABC-type multidrug transport system permease subunit
VVFEIIHMLWMGRWIHYFAITTTLLDSLPGIKKFDEFPLVWFMEVEAAG